MRKILFIVILLLLTVINIQAQIIEDAYNPLSIEHDGLERLAHVYEPDMEINAAMIALHPFFSSGRAMEALSGLNTIADERGWVIVYPEAAQPYWDDGRSDIALPPDNGPVDDVGYLAKLADTLRETYQVDEVYLTGLGVGGTMALRATCETPEKYAAVAIVNALMWTYQLPYCENTENISSVDMLFIKGTEDHIYWTDGRALTNSDWEILSVEATAQFWADRYTCGEFSESDLSDSQLALSQSCTDDTTIAFLPIINGGNNWSRMGDNQLNHTGIDTAHLIAAFFGKDDDWQTWTVQEEIPESLPRSYALYVPTSYDPTTPTPVVLSLHGRGANNFSQAVSTNFNAVAEKYGFIVVYPQAYDNNYNNPDLADATWNYYLGILPNQGWDDDVFLDMVVDDLALILNVDMNRLYVNGLSNGGYMTHRLACTRGDRYAAFAAVAANAPFGVTDLCQAGNHAPIMLYHGTADAISPWAGAPGTVAGQTIYMLAPIPNTLAFWLRHNDCDITWEQTDLPNTDPDSRVIYVRYTGCPDDAAVEMYAIVGGGHIWHGVSDFENTFLGEVNMDVNASEAIWAFYSRFTLEGRNDETAIDFDPGEPTEIGTGAPNIPGTTDEVGEVSSPQSPERIVGSLQAGGFTIFLAVDLSETFDCDADSVSEDVVAEVSSTIDALGRMEIPIGSVYIQDDCRTQALGELVTGDNVTVSTFSVDDLSTTVSALPEEATNTIIVGGAAQAAEAIRQHVEGNQSILIQANGTTILPIAIVPPQGWSILADTYETIINSQ